MPAGVAGKTLGAVPVSGSSVGRVPDPRMTELDRREENQKEDEMATGGKIVIHVCDENRKLNKDFKCDKHTLLAQMKYFEKFQPAGCPGASSTALEDLDISVHCDIQIFEWLMKYLQHPAQISKLDITNVISILISAEYLQMPKLVEECVGFIRDHLLEVMKLQIDTNCIPSPILKKLACITQIEELDELKDRKDKFLSKLYMKKLELLLDDEAHTLFRCVYCNKLFTRTQKSWMVCAKANIFIDFHGTVIAEHVADRSWDINKFIHYLRQQGALSWKEIYYKIWAHLVTLHCGECDLNFVGTEVGHCSFHSQKARFGCKSNNGTYPCCGAPAIRFDTALRNDGCTAKPHKLAAGWKTPENEKLLEEIMKRYNVVAEPFLSEHNYAEQYAALEAQVLKSGRLSQQNAKSSVDSVPLSKIKDSPPLQVMIHRYVASVGECCYSVSEDEDEEDLPSRETTSVSESRGSKTDASSTIAGSGTDKKPAEPKRRERVPSGGVRPVPAKLDVIAAPPQKQKAWRLDSIRNDDRTQMQSMVKKLRRFRNEAPAARRAAVPAGANGAASGGAIGNGTPTGGRSNAKRQSKVILY